MNKISKLMVYCVLLLGITDSISAEITPPKSFSESGIIVKVVDGDTADVKLENGKVERLRLIGMNTPETKDPRKPVQCFGKEASEKATELLNGKAVKLERDDSQDNRDKYQRLLRYIWIEGKTLFNLQMIAEGYAYEYTYRDAYKYQKEFQAAQKEAETAQKGLWHPDTCAGELKAAETQSEPTATPKPAPKAKKSSGSSFSCSPRKTCGKMSSCEEAYYHLKECGNKRLDRDKDGVPCESICPGG